MKSRMGFVSNSSSSSFVVAKSLLTEQQIAALEGVCLFPIGQYQDNWNLTEGEDYVMGYTCMDNGQDEDGLETWLKDNNYPMRAFIWERD